MRASNPPPVGENPGGPRPRLRHYILLMRLGCSSRRRSLGERRLRPEVPKTVVCGDYRACRSVQFSNGSPQSCGTCVAAPPLPPCVTDHKDEDGSAHMQPLPLQLDWPIVGSHAHHTHE